MPQYLWQSMYSTMKKPGLDQDFDSFRRQRKGSASGHAGDPNKARVWEELEAQEHQEQQKIQLTQEVDDFFVDATKLAADIVQKVAETREEQINSSLRADMEEFLLQTIRRATQVITGLGEGEGQALTEVEANIKNIVGTDLDRFRAEGTAQLEDKHLGQDPFDTELNFDHDGDDDDDDLLGDERIHLSDSELSVDFSQPLGGDFSADEFSTGDVARSAAITAPKADPAVAACAEDEEAPLAAMYAQPAEAEQPDEIELEDAPYPEMPPQAEVEAAIARQEAEQEAREAELKQAQEQAQQQQQQAQQAQAREQDRKKIKAALSLLVRQGVMSKDEAREAYRRQIS